MKRILSYALILFTINCFSVSYTTVTEECSYIRFSGNTLQDIVVDKSQVKLQKTTSKVSVVFLSGGSQTLNWDASQARSYGYSLDSLYDFILGKLMVQCDTSGGGVSQSALNDSIAALRSIRKVDSIYKKATNRDLTYFKVNGVEYSVKDSVGSGGGGSVSVSNGLIDTLGDIQLGGELNRPTEIVLNDNNFTLSSLRQPSFGSGLGLYMLHSVYGNNKGLGITNINDTWINSITNTVITNTGTTYTQLGIMDFATGYQNQITSKYSTEKGGELFWEIREDNDNSVVKLKADEREFGDRCAFRIVPTSPYIGDVVFDVKSNRTDAFQVRTNGDVRFVVPTDTTVTILYGKDSLGNLVETNIIGQIRNEIADTSAVLRGLITNSGTVTSIATGVGLSGGTITGSGTIVADTSGTLVTKAFLTSSLSGIGGGASLSSLTAATATNNILNTNYKQRWNWNTIAGDTAFAILSTSTGAASNLQNLFTVALSGANATSSQTTYAANFSNTHTGTSSTNYAIRLSASGATNNYGLTSDADLLINGITAGKGKWQGTNSSYNTAFGYNALNSAGSGCIQNTAFGRDALSTITGSIQNTALGCGAMGGATSYANCVGVGFNALNASTGSDNTGVGSVALTNQTSGDGNTAMGGGAGGKLTTGSDNVFIGAYIFNTGSNRGASENTLVGSSVGRSLTASTTTAFGFKSLYTKTSGANCVAIGYKAGYDVTTAANSVYIGNSLATSHATKNNIILLSDGSGNERVMIESDGRVGIGTTSPAASAKLDLTSTTQGFLPPRMTATQASAISSPAKALMIYVTDTNGTFTSAGWWGYNGTIWKLILAE